MSLLEFVRDKTRDNFYKKLSDIGLECELAERGIVEEKLFNPWHRNSLGIIKINSDCISGLGVILFKSSGIVQVFY